MSIIYSIFIFLVILFLALISAVAIFWWSLKDISRDEAKKIIDNKKGGAK